MASALTEIFSDFWDDETQENYLDGDCTLHTVMFEFSSYFVAASANPAQLQWLARLIEECIAIDDSLENAIGTCFLEHLPAIDREGHLTRHFSPAVKHYIRNRC
ncbi:hypothetical protein [Novosphingobium sp. ES2-1]|uniref:DUF7674 family protein n=1 Tax=Novosphingobium sp. ES2-1 TaxID=2780074 RepID=UPI0018813C4E|nr:hypothetical protein [Novosphingobium sp. ES2-1]QOV93023.1 hypothetical protein IM701_10180 [Novosphingobium sp. ES2-1]